MWGRVASAYVKGERDAPAPTCRRSPRFPVHAGPAQPAPQSAWSELGPRLSRLALVLPPPGIQLPVTAMPHIPAPPCGKRLPPRSGSKLQGGYESLFQLFPGQNALGKSRLSASDSTLQSPQRAARPFAAHTRERRKPPPPSVVTDSGHRPLTAINNLWPAATPRGLASPWPRAWKYLFREAPECEAEGEVGVGVCVYMCVWGGVGGRGSSYGSRSPGYLFLPASRY